MTDTQELRIASRGSQLARWQADRVRDDLLRAHPGVTVTIEIVRTTGDRILDVPLARIGDRGLFTKEIDDALLAGRADLAVHSLKDIPTRVPEGLALAAISAREDPRDVLIGPRGAEVSMGTLPPGARIGTSSLRRRSQLKHLRPDLEVADLRGNLDTRLRKLDEGEYDAIILAAAGVLRLGLADRISAFLEFDRWLPAVGQGALGIVCRADDRSVLERIRALHHDEAAVCVTAERAFLRELEGGCQVPIGAHATFTGGELRLDGFVADLDGERVLRESLIGPADDPGSVGRRLAARLLDRGAGAVLREVREANAAPGVPGP